MCCGEKTAEGETGYQKDVLNRAMEAIADFSPEMLTYKPDEVFERLSSVEYARQILGPEIMKRPDWPTIWCRLICWIKYIICLSRCPPFLRDVLIRSVGKVDSLSPLDNAAPIALIGKETSIGGSISVNGSANISGAGRTIKKFSLWYAPYDTVANNWVDAPPDFSPLPAGWIGTGISIDYSSPYSAMWHCGPFSGSNIVTNGSFTKRWKKALCIFPPNNQYWWLEDTSWPTPPLNGRFTVLLMVEDDLGGVYYDSQRVWIDNQQIVGVITDIKGVKKCQDLKMSLGTVSIMGKAFDPPIDASIVPINPPNDNFNYYELSFRKQGAATGYKPIPPGQIKIAVGLGVGALIKWDLKMLDAATAINLPADQLLTRGESCTYDILLFVCDKTQINDMATVHYIYDSFPVKIVNDLGS